jgi:hypothetical protein
LTLVGMGQNLLTTPCWPRRDIWLVLGLDPRRSISNASLPVRRSAPARQPTALVMLTEILFASASAALLAWPEFTPRILFGGSLIVLAALLCPGASAFFRALIGALAVPSADRRIASQWPLHFGHPFQRRFSMTTPRRLHRRQIDGTRLP